MAQVPTEWQKINLDLNRKVLSLMIQVIRKVNVSFIYFFFSFFLSPDEEDDEKEVARVSVGVYIYKN